MPYHYGGFGNWFTDIAKEIVPSHTVVGKILGGDTAGAARDAAKLAQGAVTAKAKPVPLPQVPMEPGAFSPGGFVEKNQTMLLIVAAGLGALLIMRRRR